MRRILLPLLIITTFITSCIKQPVEISLEQEIQSTTEEILTFQIKEEDRTPLYRWKALEAYEKFLRNYSEYKSERMAEAMEALANIYMEIEENTYLKNKIYDHSRSRRVYEKILKMYPGRRENERILYQIARGFAEEGKWDEANAFLERIIEEYPDGNFVQEANFRLGEYYFEYGVLKKAIYHYRQVLKKDDYYFYDRALYKLGWALFQARDYEGAADKLISLLQRKKVRLTPDGREDISNVPFLEENMMWDAIKTLVIVFDYMGGHSRIADYFRIRGTQSYEPYIYRKLGDIYLESGRFTEAAETYKAFINANPLHEDAPLFQLRIVEAYSRGNMPEIAYRERIKLIDTYKKDSLWFKSSRRRARRVAEEIIEKNKALVKKDMYQLAKFYYSRAHSSDKKEDYQKATEWLQRFISNFPEEKEVREISFLLADSMFKIGDYNGAYSRFEEIGYKQPEKTELTREAGYRTLLSLDKLLKLTGSSGKDNPYTIKLAQKCADFAELYPEDERVPEVLKMGADLFFLLGDFDRARKMARSLIENHISNKQDVYLAQKLIAESFIREKAYTKSEEELKKAISLIPSRNHKDIPVLERALAASLYKQAERFKSAGKTLEAAMAFERVYAEVPDSDITPVALFNAGVLYEENKEWGSAIRIYATLFQNFPESDYTINALIRWAEIKERDKDYSMAAQLYERVSTMTGDKELKKHSLYRAIHMYEKEGYFNKLYDTFLKFEKQFSRSAEIVELTFKVAKSRESAGDIKNAKKLFRKVTNYYKRLGSHATIQDSFFAARAMLRLSDYRKAAFEKVKLVQPLEKNFKKKEALLKKALSGYTAAAKYRIIDITTEATYKMGEMMEHLRDAILTSERPEELTPEQLEEYDFLLEEQALPFEERAISFHETNIRKTLKNGIYNEWIKKSYKHLSTLLPVKYRRIEAGKLLLEDYALTPVDDSEFYNNKAIKLREKGAFKKAEEMYLRSIAIKPDFPDPHLNLGILYEIYLDRPEKALKNYKEYVRLGGKRKEVLTWIDLLEKKIGKKVEN